MKIDRLQREPKPKRPEHAANDDSIVSRLSEDEQRRLTMDAWEPTLLRELLSAQNRSKR